MQKMQQKQLEKNLETAIELQPQTAQSSRTFEILIVQNNEDQSVEVIESTVIDFNQIIENLNQGNSIFITQRTPSKPISQKTRHKGDFINHI